MQTTGVGVKVVYGKKRDHKVKTWRQKRQCKIRTNGSAAAVNAETKDKWIEKLMDAHKKHEQTYGLDSAAYDLLPSLQVCC